MKPPSKSQMYQRVLEEMQQTNRYKSLVTPFTKIEKMKTTKYKAPRMIQARHPSFNILYGSFVKSLEHQIIHHPYYGRHFGKGTSDTIAQRIYRLKRKYKFVTEGDHKTFDSHVTIDHKKAFHTYLSSCFQHDKTLTRLARQTLSNFCISRDGIKYRVKGTVMSGDVDTSFGNCMINLAILKELLQQLSLDGEAIVNGDDFLLFTNHPINTDKAKEILHTMNMETDLKQSQTSILNVEFCGSKLVLEGSGKYVLLHNPQKALDTYGMTHHIHVDRNKYLRDLAVCYAHMEAHNPIGYHFAQAFNITIDPDNIPIPDTVEAKLKYYMSTLVIEHISKGEITHDILYAYPDIEHQITRIYQLPKLINTRIARQLPNIHIDHDHEIIEEF